MKTAVVFYSFEGNTKFAARAIAKALDAHLLEIKPIKEIKTHGFMKYFWGGMAASLKKTPQLIDYDFKVDEYDLVIIGTPIWASTIAPPIRTFITDNTLKNIKLALFTCNASGHESKAALAIQEITGNTLEGVYNIKNPFFNKDTEALAQAEEWAKSLS